MAATLAGVAVLLWRPTGRWWIRARIGTTPPRVPVAWSWLAGVAVAVVVLPRLPHVAGPLVAVALTAGGVAVFAGRHWRASRRRERVARRRSEVVELMGLMSAELRAGMLAPRVLAGLARDFDLLVPASRAADLGGDVAAALRHVARVPGREVLVDLAGAWQVAQRSGAPLAAVIGRLEHAARADRDTAAEIEAAVAPARATARLMAALPGLGLMLGVGMGGDPVHVLTATWLGAACLAGGCTLACLGVAWIEHIASTAAGPG